MVARTAVFSHRPDLAARYTTLSYGCLVYSLDVAIRAHTNRFDGPAMIWYDLALAALGIAADYNGTAL